MYHVLCYINFVSLSVPPLCLCLSVSLSLYVFYLIINSIVPSLIYPSWLQITLASLLSQWSSHIVPYSPSPLHTSTRPSWGAWPPESLTSPGEQVKPVAKRERERGRGRGREREREREGERGGREREWEGEGGRERGGGRERWGREEVVIQTQCMCVCVYVQLYKCIHACMHLINTCTYFYLMYLYINSIISMWD